MYSYKKHKYRHISQNRDRPESQTHLRTTDRCRVRLWACTMYINIVHWFALAFIILRSIPEELSLDTWTCISLFWLFGLFIFYILLLRFHCWKVMICLIDGLKWYSLCRSCSAGHAGPHHQFTTEAHTESPCSFSSNIWLSIALTWWS